MSLADTIGRIEQIQSTLSRLAGPARARVTDSTTAGGAAAGTTVGGAAAGTTAGGTAARGTAAAAIAAAGTGSSNGTTGLAGLTGATGATGFAGGKAGSAVGAAPDSAFAQTLAAMAAPVVPAATAVSPAVAPVAPTATPPTATPPTATPALPVAGPGAVESIDGDSIAVDSIDAALGSGQGTTGVDVVTTARKYIGVPYVWGGEDPSGMDCSGFVQWVFKDLGIDVPRVVGDQMNVGSEVPDLAAAKPGDLLVTLGGNHISIYLGGNKAIDAPQPGQNIAVRELWETDANLDTIRRIVPSAPGAATGTSAADLAAAQAAFIAGLNG